ncbi:hypothetical protein BGZ46_002944 [Entomortierella lignicola]|nr:hypothetical protein BGZ46_002944 [Entomortierella lignicola]
MQLSVGDDFNRVKVYQGYNDVRLLWYKDDSLILTPSARPEFAMVAPDRDVDVTTLMMDTQSNKPKKLMLGYDSLSMEISECVRAWYSSLAHPPEFECFVSPWLESLNLERDYDLVTRQNLDRKHPEWCLFYDYFNGSMATSWGFRLFININKASKYRGNVIVRVTGGKLVAYSYEMMYVYQDLKRRLEYEKRSEIPSMQWGSDEISSEYNYYTAKDLTYNKYHEKCSSQLNDENLRELISSAEEANARNGRMYSFQFREPVQVGLMVDLLSPLISR